MYAWKCWRDSRLVFTVFLLFEVVFFAVAFFLKASLFTTSLTINMWQVHEASEWLHFQRYMLYTFPFITSFVGTSSFVLTRPHSRGRIVWTALAVATAEFVVVFFLAGASAAIHITHTPIALNLSMTPTLSVASVIVLLVLANVLGAEIVRSGFAFLMLLLPRRKNFYSILLILVVFGCFVGATLQPQFLHSWGFWQPVLVPEVFVDAGRAVALQPHLYLNLLLRGVLVVGLTFASQKVLERREV